MSCKKNQSPSICPPSSRRLLETLAIRDLPPTGIVCMPSLNRDSESSPAECGPCACDEDDCAPGTCCALNRECETSSRPVPGQDLATETCLPNCKSVEVETMIDEMKSCQEIIRTLALEAMEILHSEHECPMCKQVAQAQKGPQAIEKGPRYEDCNDTKLIEPANQQYLGTEGQSRTKFFSMPSTQLKSCAHSRTSSVPIAQTAFQIKEGRLPKADDIDEKYKIRSKADIKGSLKKDKSDIDIEDSLKKKSKPDCDIDQCSKLQKIFGPKPSACSCDGEKNLDVNCACRGKIDCKCGSKSYFQRIFGKKPSICSCKEDPTMQNEENEGRISKNKMFRKKIDCVCPEDKDKIKQQNEANSVIEKRSSVNVGQIEIRKSGAQASFGLPKCDKDICQCHFPPSYDQFFTCTGQVTGNCSCKKNV